MHARVEPFANQSEHAPRRVNPMLEKGPQVGMIQRVEKLPDVHFQDPAASLPIVFCHRAARA